MRASYDGVPLKLGYLNKITAVQHYGQPLHIFLGIVSLFNSLGVDFIFQVFLPPPQKK